MSPSLISKLRDSTAARDGVYVLAGQGTATAIALALQILLFRALSTNERGTLSAALLLRNVLLAIADVGLALTTVRVASEYSAKGQKDAANFVFRRALAARFALAAVVCILSGMLAPLLTGFPLASGHRTGLVWASSVALFGMTASSWGVDVSQASRRFKLYFAHQVSEAAFKTASAIAIVGLIGAAAFASAHAEVIESLQSMFKVTQQSLSAEAVLWSMAAGATAAGLFSLLIQRDALEKPKTLDPEVGAKILSRIQSFNRYGGMIALLHTLSGSIEIFLIQWYWPGGDKTAVFDGARQFALVLPLIGGTLTTVLLPRAAALQSVEACALYLRKSVKASIVLGLFSAGGLAVFAGIVPILFGSRYADSVPLLRWLCAAYGMTMMLNPLILVLYPLRREALVVILYVANIAFSIGAGMWLVPQYGALGAAWSTLVAKLILAIIYGVVLWTALRSAKSSDLSPAEGAS